MKFKYIGYAALATVAAAAFVLGTAGSSEAAKKKAMAAPHPAPCFEPNTPVCGAKGGMKFTYANSCYAGKDGATVVSDKACPAPKAKKAHKKGGGKAMAKPAKKKAIKKKM